MAKLSPEDFTRLVSYVKSVYGINLEKKQVLIEGRLSSAMSQLGYEDFTSYLDFVFADRTGSEMTKLVNRLTTNHTFFLREPDHFEHLRTVVLPYFESTVIDRDARIWCAACSTGQEPYTMAMVIDEYFGERKSGWDLKILATDISTNVLHTARAGEYTIDMLKDVPERWIHNYFEQIDEDRFRIVDRIRKEVVFKQFNLMDPIVCKRPFHLISCRNVMIYFDNPTKNALIERFYDVTKNGGYFYIGHAETVSKESRYKYIKPAIYRKAEEG